VQQSSGRLTLAGEKAILEAAAHLPEGYKHSLSPRVEQARRAVNSLARLERVLGGPSSEAAVVAAWRAVQEAKCESLVGANARPRIDAAVRRAPMLRVMSELPADLPADQRDRKILENWDEALLKDCREADPFRAAHAQAVQRRDALARVQAAIDTRNEVAIVQAMQDPCLAGYPLPHAWTGPVRRAQQRVGQAEALLAALQQGQRAAFRELFDARLIRQYADRFAPLRQVLADWTAADMLSLDVVGLGHAVGRASLVPLDEPAGAYRVRWSWPQPRLTDHCLLAICPNEPATDEPPERVAAFLRVPIDRRGWEVGGGSRAVNTEPEWGGAFAVVWAVIDLGFRAFYSQPLVLGRLEERRTWPWQNWGPFAARRGGTAPAKTEGEPT